MTTHYILADDYDRWNPGEPIEDVASDVDYLHTLYQADEAFTGSFGRWLSFELLTGKVVKVS